MPRFEIFSKNRHCWVSDLSNLRLQLQSCNGEADVHYTCRLGQHCTLFLTIKEGRVCQRFKSGNPELDWAWLSHSTDAPQQGHLPIIQPILEYSL